MAKWVYARYGSEADYGQSEPGCLLLTQIFPDLRAKSPAEQKSMLNKAIERARADREVMSDPRTDTRALVLGWPPHHKL